MSLANASSAAKSLLRRQWGLWFLVVENKAHRLARWIRRLGRFLQDHVDETCWAVFFILWLRLDGDSIGSIIPHVDFHSRGNRARCSSTGIGGSCVVVMLILSSLMVFLSVGGLLLDLLLPLSTSLDIFNRELTSQNLKFLHLKRDLFLKNLIVCHIFVERRHGLVR